MTTRQTTVIEEDPTTDDDAPTRWWARRRWQALIVALAVVASAGAVFAGTRGDGEDLPRTPPRTSYGLFDKKPGDTDFSMGGLRIFEPGKTVQIVSAKALTSPNVEYLGAYAVWPRDYVPPPGVGEGFPYPDQRRRHDLTEPIPASETAHFEPDSSTSVPITVTLGFRILSAMGGVNGIHLTYKVNGKTKTQYFSDAAIGCVKPLNCEDDDSLTDGNKGLRELGLVRED